MVGLPKLPNSSQLQQLKGGVVFGRTVSIALSVGGASSPFGQADKRLTGLLIAFHLDKAEGG
jgi:hypothetical protein